MAYVALDPGPVRAGAPPRAEILLHPCDDGEVGYQVAVEVTDLTLPVAERRGAEPAWLRGNAGPTEDLPLDRLSVAVHGSSFSSPVPSCRSAARARPPGRAAGRRSAARRRPRRARHRGGGAGLSRRRQPPAVRRGTPRRPQVRSRRRE